MSDRERDPHPDSPPESGHDERSDIEQAVESRSDELRRRGADSDSPLEPTVSPDSAGGAGGEVKNQGDAGQ
ncbi:hypothetical protein [Sphingomonas sp. DT-204]|uniref:hypothetical protein n=1 Tax=Sphingomonas sp. DT-204 TaxID=3396166 RepID=UPI003F1CB626